MECPLSKPVMFDHRPPNRYHFVSNPTTCYLMKIGVNAKNTNIPEQLIDCASSVFSRIFLTASANMDFYHVAEYWRKFDTPKVLLLYLFFFCAQTPYVPLQRHQSTWRPSKAMNKRASASEIATSSLQSPQSCFYPIML